MSRPSFRASTATETKLFIRFSFQVLQLPLLARDAGGDPRQGGRVHELRGPRHELPHLARHPLAARQGHLQVRINRLNILRQQALISNYFKYTHFQPSLTLQIG